MTFGSLFRDLSHACIARAIPRIEAEVVQGGGTLPLHVPGPLIMISAMVAVLFYSWYVTVHYFRRYHVTGIAEAMKARRPALSVVTYRSWTGWKPMRDVRTTVIPLIQTTVVVGLGWVTWMAMAFRRGWPFVWTDVREYCHPVWQGFFWIPMVLGPPYIVVWLASGGGGLFGARPWNCRDLRLLMVKENTRLSIRGRHAAVPGSLRDMIALGWFNVRWLYYSHGASIGLVLYGVLVWLVHDIYVVAFFRIDWNVRGTREELTEHLQGAWGAWKEFSART